MATEGLGQKVRFSRTWTLTDVWLRPGKGGLDVIRKEAWPFYRTSSGVRLCCELEEPKGPKGPGEQENVGSAW